MFCCTYVAKAVFLFAVPQWLKFSFFLQIFCNWISWVSDLRYESWHDATNQSWLMQRLNIVAGTRLYTGRRHTVSQAAFSREKTYLRFPNCSTQTSLYDYKMFKARHLRFKNKCNSTVREMKTKALAITQLICAFVFASVNNEFSRHKAPINLFM